MSLWISLYDLHVKLVNSLGAGVLTRLFLSLNIKSFLSQTIDGSVSSFSNSRDVWEST